MARKTVVGSAEYQVGADLKPLRKDLKQAEGWFKKSGITSGTTYKKALSTGIGVGGGLVAVQALSKGFSAITGTIGRAVREATEFEMALGTVNTVAKLSDRELEAMGDSVQDLAVQSGKMTGELTDGLYSLVSAGVDASHGMSVLEDATTLSLGALSTTNEAVDLMTTTLNAWSMEATESARVMDVFAQTVANGKITASELAASISQVAPIASSAGVAVEEVAAAYATMTAQGTKAEQAATQIRGGIVALLKPNSEMLKLQESLNGETFEGILRSEGYAAALEAVSTAAGGNTETITRAMGRVEGYNGMLQVTGDNAGKMAANLDDMRQAAEEGGNALRMASKRTDTLAHRQDRLAAKQQVLLQDIGAVLMPFMEGVTELGGAVIDTLRGIGEGIDMLLDAAGKLGDPLGESAAALDEWEESLGAGGEGAAAWVRRQVMATKAAEDMAVAFKLAGVSADEQTYMIKELTRAVAQSDWTVEQATTSLANLVSQNTDNIATEKALNTEFMASIAIMEALRGEMGLAVEGHLADAEATTEQADANAVLVEAQREYLRTHPEVLEALLATDEGFSKLRPNIHRAMAALTTTAKVQTATARSTRELSGALSELDGVTSVAAGGLDDLKDSAEAADKAWKDLGKKDENRKAIKLLNREIEEWETNYQRAVKNNNSARASLAAAILEDLYSERRGRKEVRKEVRLQSEELANAEAADRKRRSRRKGDLAAINKHLGIGGDKAEALREKLQEAFGKSWRTKIDLSNLTAAQQKVADVIAKLAVMESRAGIVPGGGSDNDPTTPYARGGWASPGLHLVGEEGPELRVEPRSGLYLDAMRTVSILEGRNTATASATTNAATMSGRIEHRHTITAEGAQNLQAAGYDTDAIADLLQSAAREAGTRYRWT